MPYRALDPELIAWVHTCIPWGIMMAYDRYKRPLTVEEKDRYLTEQAVIGRMGGADWVPSTVAELDAYVERMRPTMGMNEQTRSFMDFLLGRSDDFAVGPFEKFDRWASIRGSMMLMPEWARRLTGTWVSPTVQRAFLEPNNRLRANAVRWAYPAIPCKAMAIRRATAKRAEAPAANVAA